MHNFVSYLTTLPLESKINIFCEFFLIISLLFIVYVKRNKFINIFIVIKFNLIKIGFIIISIFSIWWLVKENQNLNSIFISTLGAFILWLFCGLLWYIFTSKQENFHDFFLGRKQAHKIVIIISNLKRQTRKIEGNQLECNLHTNFHEVEGVLSESESNATIVLNELINSPSLQTPDILTGLVDKFWTVKKPLIDVRVSDLKDGNIEDGNSFIIIGSTNKNSVRRFFIKQKRAKLKFKWETAEQTEGVQISSDC